MANTLKAGDRVKLTIEGTIGTTYGTTYELTKEDTIAIVLENSDEVYIETSAFLKDLNFEVIREFTDGLYYDAAGPDDPFSQISLVYKREGSGWYNAQLDQVKLTPEDEAGLVRLGAVE